MLSVIHYGSHPLWTVITYQSINPPVSQTSGLPSPDAGADGLLDAGPNAGNAVTLALSRRRQRRMGVASRGTRRRWIHRRHLKRKTEGKKYSTWDRIKTNTKQRKTDLKEKRDTDKREMGQKLNKNWTKTEQKLDRNWTETRQKLDRN